MKEMHYGFFRKSKDFFVHPSEMFESLLLEPVERTATIIVPQLLILFVLNFFVYTMGDYTAFANLLPNYFQNLGFSFILILVASYFFFMHGFMRLLGGSGSMADTFAAYGYTALFVSYTQIVCLVFAVILGLIYPLLALIPIVALCVLNIWAMMSLILGFMVTHNIGALRVIFAIILTSITVMFVYLMTSGILLDILHFF